MKFLSPMIAGSLGLAVRRNGSRLAVLLAAVFVIFAGQALAQEATILGTVTGTLILGVLTNDCLSVKDRVTKIIEACSKTLYALRVLRTHGLAGQSLETLYRATVQARLLYASPAWSGLCSADDRDRLDAFLRRSKRSGCCCADTPSISELFEQADECLFSSVLM